MFVRCVPELDLSNCGQDQNEFLTTSELPFGVFSRRVGISVPWRKSSKRQTLQTVPASGEAPTRPAHLAPEAGFSLHAGVMAEARQPDTLERLCRYIGPLAVSEKHWALTTNGHIRYQLKTP